ncbi:zinc finger, matrin-type 2 [Clydaea vesicula]|uniref:Zinc finger, matrin-type 2 n=1 Tax=Clydaea vesicula TaxID=447962 RepID=A0AAD5UBN6_9FUNG|nr:zinc finger, matrin-type 2 [Clydaea vesicula]
MNEEHKERKHKKKKEKRPRTPSPEPEKLLQARTKTLGLDQNVGKAQVVQGSREAGFYCEDCDVVLKDQVSYLDHINGRQHLKMIGVSMNVEKSTLAQVKERFEEIKRRAKEPKKIFGK